MILKTGRPPVTLSSLHGHSVGATGSAFARSALPRKRVRSLDQERKIVAMAIKWKLGDDSTETILIDRYSADILMLLLERLEENDWKGAILGPPDAGVPS